MKTLTVWARWKRRGKNNVGAAEREGVKPLTVWARWKRRGKNNVGAAGGEGGENTNRVGEVEEKRGEGRKMWLQQEGGVTNRVGAVKEERGQERTMLVQQERGGVKTLTVRARSKRRGKNNVSAAGGG